MFILFYTKVQGTSYAPPRDLEKPVANGSAKGYDTKATKPAAEPASGPEFLATFWSCCTCCICILLCKFKLGKRGGNRTWKILWPEPQLQRDIMRLMRYLQFSALSLYGYTPYGLIWQACLTDHSRGSTVPAFASTASTTSTICKAGELFKGCNWFGA